MGAPGGFVTVKDYRLYYLDRFSGHIDEVEEFAAEGDDRAIEMAGRKCNGRAMELWHRHHKLRHWDEALPVFD